MCWKVEKRAPQVKYAAMRSSFLAISTSTLALCLHDSLIAREQNLRVDLYLLYLFIEIKRQLKNNDSLIS